jgi:hypothetical protein
VPARPMVIMVTIAAGDGNSCRYAISGRSTLERSAVHPHAEPRARYGAQGMGDMCGMYHRPAHRDVTICDRPKCDQEKWQRKGAKPYPAERPRVHQLGPSRSY